MTEPGDLIEILEDIDHRMEKARLGYMLVGSVLSSVYGEPRFTRDIDVVVALTRFNVPAVITAFEDEYLISAEAVRHAVMNQGSFNALHRRLLMKVDMMVLHDDPFGELEFVRRRRMPIAGVEVWVASPEDTILYKLHWRRQGGSDVQIRDVVGIIASMPDLDWRYMEKWSSYLGVKKDLLELRP